MSKSLFILTIASTTLPALAQVGTPVKRPITLRPSADVIKVPNRSPISFKSFGAADITVHNANGQITHPKLTDTVQLTNGRKVTAKAFLDSTNQLEQRLNKYGYTLRQAVVVPQTDANPRQFSKGQSDIDGLAGGFKLSGKGLAMNGVPYEQYMAENHGVENDTASATDLLAPGDSPVSEPKLTSTAAGGTMTYAQHAGQRWSTSGSDFGAYFSYSVDIAGTAEVPKNQQFSQSLSEFSVAASADAGVVLLGSDESLVHVDASYKGSDKTKTVSLAANLTVCGFSVIQESGTYDIGYAYGDTWSKTFDLGGSMGIPIGPFTINCEAGIQGTAGVSYGYKLRTSYVQGKVQPFVASSAYFKADAGFDIGIASADVGIEGNLTLFNDTLTLECDAGVVYDKGFKFTNTWDLENEIDAFDGRIDVYANAELGWGPFSVSKTWRKTLLDWPGIKANAVLYKNTYTLPLSWH